MSRGCKCATSNGEGRYNCSVSGDGCMYFIPDSKRCAEDYGEGPDANPESEDGEESEEFKK